MCKELGKLQYSLLEGELNLSMNTSARNFAGWLPRPTTSVLSKYFTDQFSPQNTFLS